MYCDFDCVFGAEWWSDSCIGLTYKSFRSHPEQFFWLHGNASVKIMWIHWLHLDGNLVCKDLIQPLFSVIS